MGSEASILALQKYLKVSFFVTCPAHIKPTDVSRIIPAHEYRARVKSLAEQIRGIRICHCRNLNLHLSKWDGFLWYLWLLDYPYLLLLVHLQMNQNFYRAIGIRILGNQQNWLLSKRMSLSLLQWIYFLLKCLLTVFCDGHFADRNKAIALSRKCLSRRKPKILDNLWTKNCLFSRIGWLSWFFFLNVELYIDLKFYKKRFLQFNSAIYTILVFWCHVHCKSSQALSSWFSLFKLNCWID